MDIVRRKKIAKRPLAQPLENNRSIESTHFHQGPRASHSNTPQEIQSRPKLPKSFYQERTSGVKTQNTHNKRKSSLFYKSKKRKRSLFRKTLRFFLFLLTVMLVSALILGGYTFFKIHNTNKKIIVNNDLSLSDSAKFIASSIYEKERSPLKGEENGRINILLLGIAGEGKPGTNLTDTIMIASINTKTKKIALMSLPRDLYVNVADYSHSSKINSIYQFGISQKKDIEPLVNTVEAITDLPIHYHVILNFDGFIQIIDDVGKITVTNERDIYDPRYPGPNYSYELFELKKGTHLLDGATALKYARQRHGDPQGDFGRAKRQQQVIQSFKNKVFSAKTFLNIFTINKLLDDLGNNLKTNIQLEEIGSLIELIKELDTQNITNTVVDAWKRDSLLRVSHIYHENGRAFILVPRSGNFSEVQDMSLNIFELDNIKRRKSEIEKEDAKVAIINYTQQGDATRKIHSLLKNNLGFKNVKIIKNVPDSDLAPEKTMVINISQEQKNFSLDEIIKKVPANLATNTEIINEDSETIEKYDIFIIIGEETKELYDYEERVLENLSEEELNKLYLESSI